MSDLLIIRTNILLNSRMLTRMYYELLSQKKSGLVVLPSGCDALIVPDDVDIVVEDTLGNRDKEKKMIDEKIKLQIEMIDHLLKFRFTWDEIELGLGFKKQWYEQVKKEMENAK